MHQLITWSQLTPEKVSKQHHIQKTGNDDRGRTFDWLNVIYSLVQYSNEDTDTATAAILLFVDTIAYL